MERIDRAMMFENADSVVQHIKEFLRSTPANIVVFGGANRLIAVREDFAGYFLEADNVTLAGTPLHPLWGILSFGVRITEQGWEFTKAGASEMGWRFQVTSQHPSDIEQEIRCAYEFKRKCLLVINEYRS